MRNRKKEQQEIKERQSRIRLCREIIGLNNSILEKKSINHWYGSVVSALLLFTFYGALQIPPFNLLSTYLAQLLRPWLAMKSLQERTNILGNYYKLRSFRFPDLCRENKLMGIDTLYKMPWRFSDLISGNQTHFLFAFSRALRSLHQN